MILDRRFALWGSKVRVQVGSAEDRLIQARRREEIEKRTGVPWADLDRIRAEVGRLSAR